MRFKPAIISIFEFIHFAELGIGICYVCCSLLFDIYLDIETIGKEH